MPATPHMDWALGPSAVAKHRQCQVQPWDGLVLGLVPSRRKRPRPECSFSGR